MKNLLKYGTMVIAIVFVLISCDTDPTELGGEFLGIDVDNTIIEEDFEVTAYSARLNPVQTNNFGSVQLGRYLDPIYGKSTYDFVSQLSLSNTGVDFSEDAVFNSVTLEIPYFSRQTGTDGEATTYELDSIYGTDNINFQIYENKFFLNSFDPNNVEQSAAYYSDLGEQVDAIKGDAIELVNGNTLIENFKPSNEEIVITESVEGVSTVRDRLTPRLQLELNADFWKNLLIDSDGQLKFDSNTEFQNAFRGLYFKVTDDNDSEEGKMFYLDLAEARIIIKYISKFQDINDLNDNGDTDEIIEVDSEYSLSFSGNRAVFVDEEIPNEVELEINDSFNSDIGSERVYVKGGPGAIAFIDLFGPDLIGSINGGSDGVADELANFMGMEVLINEATLEVFVDQEKFPEGYSVSAEPETILLYNIVDRTIVGFGILERDQSSGRGIKYVIDLTQYVSSIVEGVVENKRLGLTVSQNLSSAGISRVKNQTQPLQIESIPVGSAISHEGTVLHGNLSSDPEKRLKLKIFYTEVN
ncbi:hypothetical protein AAU57_02185 [Nonlabens sp. YIK11]|uniref:DUF4270 domain-containing protein n=1 Tax=Nonlabens sp. YIK11 TaxID=1453349 RepID=UPI0006DD08BC|nr:DUF4270 domain-containing protein [Nonlabens sp. YIK11]KQC32264.1 hypothetical protein AAU57_02185 [Nonlabens sp. YIK11]